MLVHHALNPPSLPWFRRVIEPPVIGGPHPHGHGVWLLVVATVGLKALRRIHFRVFVLHKREPVWA